MVAAVSACVRTADIDSMTLSVDGSTAIIRVLPCEQASSGPTSWEYDLLVWNSTEHLRQGDPERVALEVVEVIGETAVLRSKVDLQNPRGVFEVEKRGDRYRSVVLFNLDVGTIPNDPAAMVRGPEVNPGTIGSADDLRCD
jgi:hypothetical protein